MNSRVLKFGAAMALLLVSGAAYADDPTGVLLQERHAYGHHYGHYYHGNVAAFSDVGPCGPGTQSIAFPNPQGYRCVPRY